MTKGAREVPAIASRIAGAVAQSGTWPTPEGERKWGGRRWWQKDCAPVLVGLVVWGWSMLFGKKISRKSPPPPARIWMIVVATRVMNGPPRHSMFGRMAAGRT